LITSQQNLVLQIRLFLCHQQSEIRLCSQQVSIRDQMQRIQSQYLHISVRDEQYRCKTNASQNKLAKKKYNVRIRLVGHATNTGWTPVHYLCKKSINNQLSFAVLALSYAYVSKLHAASTIQRDRVALAAEMQALLESFNSILIIFNFLHIFQTPLTFTFSCQTHSFSFHIPSRCRPATE
jgi:hypothetical protein